MQSNIQDMPQTLLVQCINSLHISFVDCSTLWPTQHYWQ